MYQRATDTGPIKITSSGGGSGTQQADEQDLIGNQAVQEHLKGQECSCGGIGTGLFTTSPSDAKDTEHRYQADLDFEAEWSKWIHYPDNLLEQENQKVETYNRCFDGLNANMIGEVEGRYEGTMQSLDGVTDTNVYGAIGGGSRATPAWQAQREQVGNSGAADMWRPEAQGEAFSGFEGDLSYKGRVSSPDKANWTPANLSLQEAFSNTEFDDPSGMGYGVPTHGYAQFVDANGKTSTHTLYGFGQTPPLRNYLNYNIYFMQHWCPVYEDNRKGLELKQSGSGKSTTDGGHNYTSGGDKPKGIEGYMQCEEIVRRHMPSGKNYDPYKNVSGADILIESKVKEAKEWEGYHTARLDYIEAMESGPAKNL